MKTLIIATAITILSYATIAPLRVGQLTPVAAQDETAAVQTTLDALKAKDIELSATLANVVAAVEKIESSSPADPVTKSLFELGCRANDPAFDNAPLIQPVLDAGYNLDVDGLYYTSPLKTPVGKSNVIAGQGAGYRHAGKGVTGFAAFRADQTHVLELQGDGAPGQNQVVRDLYIQGTPTADGIRAYAGRNLAIQNVTVRNCGGRGILIEPKQGSYALSVANCSLLGNGVGFELKNATTVCCFTMTSTEIQSGGQGIIVDGWRRGATFIGVSCEGQTGDTKVTVNNARATFIGCYIEGDAGKTGLLLARGSRVNVVDSSIGGYRASGDSQLNWVGDNMQAGTIGW